jgi:predicted nucleic acid-binding protein
MQEFYVAATAKLGADPLLIKDILRSLERFETVLVSPMLIKEAIDCAIINRLSFWDALIVEAATRQKDRRLFNGAIYAHQLRTSIGACVNDLEIITRRA